MCLKEGSAPADLIFENGTLFDPDAGVRGSAWVAVAQGRVAAVGTGAAAYPHMNARTRVVDLNGRLLLPGFTDAHIHFYEWALNRRHVQLAGAASFDAAMDALREAARRARHGRWILGLGFNETDWPEHRMPNRNDLDAAIPDHPAIIWRCDLHLAVANSRALSAADIRKHTPDPPDGRIERDHDGRPTGVLRELAINCIREKIPHPSENEVDEALSSAISAAHTLGITGIHDIRLMDDADGAAAFSAFQRLDASNRLDLRCWVTLPGNRLREAIALGLRTGFGNDRLRVGHVKFFADGGMGARTAWMIEPYLDAKTGMPLTSIAEIESAVESAQSAGLSVMIHSVGDRTTRELVSMFERLPNGPIVPHRIEHAQMIRPEDIPRLAALNVAVCATPPNMILDIHMIDKALGPRGRWTYAFGDLIQAAIPLMFSSDCPVCDPNPLMGIHAAVTRQRRDGTPAGGWYPELRVGLADSLRAYTSVPARVHGVGNRYGKIAPGCDADLAVLDRNIFAADPMEIAETKVDMTLFGGRIVYER